MRWLALLFAVAACGGGVSGGKCSYNGVTYASGSTFPAGDGCNSCRCSDGMVSCTKLACADASIDAPINSCNPTGGCPDGPACGTVCCNLGEACIQGVCRCGAGSACDVGDTCMPPGPAGGSACGTICCGVSGPCPQ